ncbi:helix-turn-helix domain-containing protein [Vermiculatibacterium agrestimuris]|uniref:helix-turn-helix domain-containing protein n=1 Tax=Vermiculatibacterium agrestimuris TaxID=2941519 RepID=UPI00203EC4C9|nr:helix-turn-helix transcriptional regulator [Vermiculatibacterium agrestimuris]
MFKNKASGGKLNISGKKISELRMALPGKISQKKLADMLQLEGLGIEKNAIQKIESGERFVTDIELKAFAKVFGVTTDDLLPTDQEDEKDPAG